MPLICLPCEVYLREFDSKLLLATRLAAEYNHRVLIGFDKIFNALIPNLGPVCLVDKALSSIIYQGRIKQAIAAGSKVAISDEEGFNNLGIRGDKSFLARVSREAVEAIDLYACWGQRDFDFYDQVPGLQSKSRILGSSRSDLLNHIGKRFYQPMSDSLAMIYGKYVLISDNFAVERLGIKGMPKYAVDSATQTAIEAEFEEWLEIALLQREYFTDVIKQVVVELEDLQFVIRPHPASNPRWWHGQFGQHRNAHIIHRHPAEAWIHGALATVTMGCTIGVQSIVAKTPTLEVTSPNLPIYGTAPRLIDTHFQSGLDLAKALQSIAINQWHPQVINTGLLAQSWASLGSSSTAIMAKAIHQLALKLPASQHSIPAIPRASQLRPDRIKWDTFPTLNDVKEKAKRASLALGIRSVRVDKVCPGLWNFSPLD